MDSESIVRDLHQDNYYEIAKYNELKNELIDLLKDDVAVKTGDCSRTEYLLKEVSTLIKNIDFNNEEKYKTTSLEVIVKKSITLKFEPKEGCGGNSYTSKGALLKVKKISEDGKWLFISDGGSKGWIHISNIEYKDRKVARKTIKKLRLDKFMSKYLKIKK